MRRATSGYSSISSVHGQPTNLGSFGKHLGYDYAGNGMVVVAPEDMTVIATGTSSTVGNYIEARGKYTHRFLHLKRHSIFRAVGVSVGQFIPEGTVIATSGNTGFTTGPHLHHDTRENFTAWNASFSNYVDWEKMLAAVTPPSTAKMPPIGSKIKLAKGTTRTTFKAGTTTVAGTIRVTDETFVYTIQGYDPKYSNRVLINSKSAGGNGVALALYYTNGVRIDGWSMA